MWGFIFSALIANILITLGFYSTVSGRHNKTSYDFVFEVNTYDGKFWGVLIEAGKSINLQFKSPGWSLCSSGGHPVIGRSLVRFWRYPSCPLKRPWVRYWTPNCPWWARQSGWMCECDMCCSALGKKAKPESICPFWASVGTWKSNMADYWTLKNVGFKGSGLSVPVPLVIIQTCSQSITAVTLMS